MTVFATQPAIDRPLRPTSGTPRRELDADLIARSLGGDRAAARELHRLYHPIAASFLRKLGTRPEELEDAGQEVFMQFFRHLGSFRGQAELKTWLFRLCITEARRVRRRRRIGNTLSTLLRREPATSAVPPAARSEATLHDLAQRALESMAPDQRLAFVLFEMEGMTGREVAEIAGSSLASAFRRLHQAQQLFCESLGVEPPSTAQKRGR